MDKNTLLLIFILFLLSSQLLSITWDIGKASIYIVIILLILNSISPETATIIKNIFSRIINLDFSLVTSMLSTVSKFILGLFFKNKGPEILDEVKNALSEEIMKVKSESVKSESVKGESVKGESVKGESVKGESVKGETASKTKSTPKLEVTQTEVIPKIDSTPKEKPKSLLPDTLLSDSLLPDLLL